MEQPEFEVVVFGGGLGGLEVTEYTPGGEWVCVRGHFPATGPGEADAELFCAVLRAVGGATVGWAEAIREHGFALGE